MADDYASLTVIADLAVAFAGFAGVFVVLRHETIGKWTELERVRLISLLTLSLHAAFLSLLPTGLAPLFEHHDEVWKMSAAIGGSTLALAGVWTFPASTRATNKIEEVANQKSAIVVARVMAALFVTALALYGLVAFEATLHRFSCYYFALMMQLAMSSLLFGRILIVRPPASAN